MKKKKSSEKPSLVIRDIILKQLKDANYFCESDSFGDRSGSWIVVNKEEESKRKPGRHLSVELSFNDEGTVLTKIYIFEEELVIKSEDGHNKIW